MDWQERLNASIAWIEGHLEGEMEWAAAAREANCSLFHFLRMFEVVTDCSPGEYLRRRRLSRAAQELAAGEGKVLDLALKYGYDSPDSFAKAFKRLFGCTPSEARKPGARLGLYGPLTVSFVLKGLQAMNYRIEERPAFSLTGTWIRVTSDQGENFKTIPAFWEKSMKDGSFSALARAAPAGSGIGVCGVCADCGTDAAYFDYLIAIETPADRALLPPLCKDVAVPAATWGIFESRGPLPKAVQETWKRIFSEWFPSSGWECADGPQLEVYGPGDGAREDYYSEIWIPLKKAAR